MTDMDHVRRVAFLRAAEAAHEATELYGPREGDSDGATCRIDGRCSCPTCGIIQALIDGALKRRGWGVEDVRRVRVGPPADALYPYRARITVDGRETCRVYHDVTEATADDVLHDIEERLRRTN